MNDSSVFISYIKKIDSTTREINSLQNSFGQKFIRKLRQEHTAPPKHKIVPINFEPEKDKEKITEIDGESVQVVFTEIFPEVKIDAINYKKPKKEKTVLGHKTLIFKENGFIYRLTFFLGKNSLKFSKIVNKKIFHYVRKFKLLVNFRRH
jgi:hypothetical protein